MNCVKWGWTNLLFLNNILGPQNGIDQCIGVSWSIATEFQVCSRLSCQLLIFSMQFYLISPLIVICMLSTDWGLKVPIVGIIASLITRLILFLQNIVRSFFMFF